MTTYDVLVSDELVPEFTNDNPRMPEGFRVVDPVEGFAGYRSKRFRVEDDNAPDWTEGLLIDPAFTAEYENPDWPTADIPRVRVTGWAPISEEALRIGVAQRQAEDNPGRRFTA